MKSLEVQIGKVTNNVRVKISSLAGFLLVKICAAYSRRKTKDWYDIAFVLLHNDAGGPVGAAKLVQSRFAKEIGVIYTALEDLGANFAATNAQGTQAYVQQMEIDHPELHPTTLAADAVLVVEKFIQGLQQLSR